MGEAKKGEEPAPAAPMLVKQENAQIIIRDQTDLYRMIRLLTKGAAIPKTLDTPEKIIACWQMATALNVRPEIAIQNMAIIHGSVAIWGQLPKALAHQTKELTYFELIRYNEKQEVIALEYKNLGTAVWGAAARIRRGSGAVNEYTFTMDDAKRAGLDKKSGPWQDYRPIMLARRCVGHGVKFDFPDALMGLAVAEYDFNDAPDLKDVTGSIDKADALNAKFSGKGGPANDRTDSV